MRDSRRGNRPTPVKVLTFHSWFRLCNRRSCITALTSDRPNVSRAKAPQLREMIDNHYGHGQGVRALPDIVSTLGQVIIPVCRARSHSQQPSRLSRDLPRYSRWDLRQLYRRPIHTRCCRAPSRSLSYRALDYNTRSIAAISTVVRI